MLLLHLSQLRSHWIVVVNVLAFDRLNYFSWLFTLSRRFWNEWTLLRLVRIILVSDWSTFNSVLIPDVRVPRQPTEIFGTNLVLDYFTMLVIYVFVHKFLTTEALLANVAVELLTADLFAAVNAVLHF